MILFKLRIIREKNRAFTFFMNLLSKAKKVSSVVYLFHDIVENQSCVKSKFSLSEKSFELFLNQQINNGKIALTFKELKQIIISKAKVKNSFFVSFDDANESVFFKAYPILKKLNIPFIIFITVELIGKYNFLTELQIKLLLEDPLCSLGSHGYHHKMFRYSSQGDVQYELDQSKQYLETTFNQTVDCFAFPYGRIVECSSQNVKDLHNSQYLFAFSAISGDLSYAWFSSKYFLPRVNVDESLVSITR
jgi:peptidoglycan/xylan/chitin deacetylase (PgdA/CDA1 family)